MSKRIPEVDILKGLCIATIVASHAGYRTLWFSYVYVYGFYFVAGYTYSRKPLGQFARGKLARLYLPFVVAHLISVPVYALQHAVSGGAYGAMTDGGGYLLDTLLFDAAGGITAAAWYLFPMTVVLFLFHFLSGVLGARGVGALSLAAYLALAALPGHAVGYVWNNCAWVVNVVIGLLLFCAGHLLRHADGVEELLFGGARAADLFVVDCVVLLVIYNSGYGMNIRAGRIPSYAINTLILVFGIHFLWSFSRIVARSSLAARAASLAGRCSLQIMLYHVMCFFPATMIVRALYGLPWPQTWARNYTDGLGTVLNIAFGLALPILGTVLVGRFRRRLGGRAEDQDPGQSASDTELLECNSASPLNQ